MTKFGPAENFPHVVRFRGETLGEISEWYTGKVSNWAKIALNNRQVNPRRLAIGETIFIPGELVVRRDPLPRSLLVSKETSQVMPRRNLPAGEQMLDWSAKAAAGPQPQTAPAAAVTPDAAAAPAPGVEGEVPSADDSVQDEEILRERERTLDELLP